MSGPARLKRLYNDYAQMQEAHAANGLIRVVLTQGDPPELYVVQFLCRGVAAVDASGNAVVSENHRATLILTAEYPRLRPIIRWMTPIYHPNFNDQGGVCLNEWYPSQSLADLCRVLGDLVQYKLYDTTSPLNLEASMWAIRHRDELPLDQPTLAAQSSVTAPAAAAPASQPATAAPVPTTWPSIVTDVLPIWTPPETIGE